MDKTKATILAAGKESHRDQGTGKMVAPTENQIGLIHTYSTHWPDACKYESSVLQKTHT
jgi:hypothetical protein